LLLLSGEMRQTIRKILFERSEYFSFGASHRTATTKAASAHSHH
jgi:hypothetical protein